MLHSSHFAVNWRCCATLGDRSSGSIWKFMASSFKCYVDHSHTLYSSGNIDVRNWVNLFEPRCITEQSCKITTRPEKYGFESLKWRSTKFMLPISEAMPSRISANQYRASTHRRAPIIGLLSPFTICNITMKPQSRKVIFDDFILPHYCIFLLKLLNSLSRGTWELPHRHRPRISSLNLLSSTKAPAVMNKTWIFFFCFKLDTCQSLREADLCSVKHFHCNSLKQICIFLLIVIKIHLATTVSKDVKKRNTFSALP